MTTTLTEDDAWADTLGLCRHCRTDCDTEPHHPDCPMALGLGTARGDVLIPAETCSGCGVPFEVGERYVPTDNGLLCLGCAATKESS